MEEDGSLYTQIHFTLQVTDRLHLARIMKGLRRVPEVVRINRVRAATRPKRRAARHIESFTTEFEVADYESDHTRFMREYLEKHPEQVEEQRKRTRAVVGQAAGSGKPAPLRRSESTAEVLSVSGRPDTPSDTH
jgi:hypothetical protein